MNVVCSGSSKKIAGDTRNNWVTMMFVTHNRYNCFRKQIYIDICIQAFHDLERFGFEFGDFGFALNHVHFLVNIPKRYSVQTAEIILKSYTARKMFEIFPGFRKRYPRGGFWSGYDHYESTGWKNLAQSSAYV
jgi:REP element-mobilizing transposase RayT